MVPWLKMYSVLFFFGCVGCVPVGCPTEVYEAETFSEALDEATVCYCNDDADWPETNWWEVFQDSQLNDLIDQALAENPSIRVAEGKVLLAQQRAKGAASTLWPHLNFDADIMQQRFSQQGILGSLLPPNLLNFAQTELNFNFSYTFDWWHKNRNLLRAALGEAMAAAAEAIQARVILSVAVADHYFRLKLDATQTMIARQYVENRQLVTDLTSQRVQAGLDSELTLYDVKRQQTLADQQLKQAELVQEQDLIQLRAYLANDFQDVIDVECVVEHPLALPPIPECLSLDLLAHRPDVQAQRNRAIAAARRVQVAEAEFYPNINLAGLGGLQAIHLRDLFQSSATYGNIGAALHLPIFQGGYLQANLGAAHAEYVIAIETYNQTVLHAVKEVLDALAAVRSYFLQWEDLQRVLSDARDIYALSERRLLHNIDSALELARAEESYLAASGDERIAHYALLRAQLALYKALGGGF